MDLVIATGSRDDCAMRAGKRGWIVALVGFVLMAAWTQAWLNVHSLPRPVAAIANVDSDSTLRMVGGLRVHVRSSGNASAAAARLDERNGIRATADGDLLTVEFGGVTESQGRAMAAAIRRPLRFQRVVDGTPFMRDLFARVERGTDREAQALGVSTDTDTWTVEHNGVRHNDWMLTAPTLDALHTYVDGLGAHGLAPPAGLEFGFQEVTARGGRHGYARTYLLDKTVVVDASMVSRATINFDPQTNQPFVIAEFDQRGGQAFGDFTAAHIGEKFATSIGEVVKFAPVINDAIRGGSVSITMGGADAREKEQEARSLVSVLSAGPLPTDGTVTDAHYVAADTDAEARNRVAKTLFALVVGMIAALTLIALQRFVVGRAHAPVQHTPTRSRVWLRGIVTLGGLALLWFGRGWVLPGLNQEELMHVFATGGGTGTLSSISVFALGVTPIISAFVVVELIALVVPPWRKLRTGDAAQRGALGRAVAVLAIVLAAVQAYFICAYLRGLPDDLAYLPGPLSSWTVGFSLVGGTLVLAVIASVISKHGIGNGFAVIFIGNQIFNWLTGARSHGLTVERVALAFATIGVVAAATFAVLRSRARDHDGSVDTTMAIPNSGIVPLNWVSSLVGFMISMRFVTTSLADVLESQWWASWRGDAVAFVALVVVTLGCAWAFSGGAHGDAAVPSVTIYRGPGLRLWRRATMLSLLYVASLFGLHVLLQGFMPMGAIVLPVFLTALGMDVVEECQARRGRNLVSVWPLHQAMRADGILSALRDANIDAHLRGRNIRMLMQFFAPWNPIEVLVPPQDADRALKLLRVSLAA